MPYIETEDGDPIEFSFSEMQLADDEEISQDELPDGLVTQDTLNDTISSRLSRQERKLKEDLKTDDSFFTEAASKRGIQLREDGQPKGALKDEEIQALRKKASKVDTLSEKVQTYESQIEETRSTQLENEVLQSADGIRDGAQDDVLSNVKSQMTYDDEYGWVAQDESGEVRYDNAEPVRADGIVSKIRENKPFLFKDRSAGSGPSDTPTSTDSSGKKTWTESEHAAADVASMDNDTYSDWLSAAEEDRIQ